MSSRDHLYGCSLSNQEASLFELRFPMLARVEVPGPMLSSIEALYDSFKVTCDIVDHKLASEAKQMMFEQLGHMLTLMSCIILEQLEQVPDSYSEQDIKSSLSHGAFQINLDDFRCYWQGVGNSGTLTLDQIVLDAIDRGQFWNSDYRIGALIQTIKDRLARGDCDIPGFELITKHRDSFVTLQYTEFSKSPWRNLGFGERY